MSAPPFGDFSPPWFAAQILAVAVEGRKNQVLHPRHSGAKAGQRKDQTLHHDRLHRERGRRTRKDQALQILRPCRSDLQLPGKPDLR